jgi:hypothetical protein
VTVTSPTAICEHHDETLGDCLCRAGVSSDNGGLCDRVRVLLDTATGKKVAALTDPDKPLLSNDFDDCGFDDRTTVVCWEADQVDGTAGTAGFDPRDGHALWRITDHDATRSPVTVTCLYNGVVYAQGPHGPVELDAHSGDDLVDDPGAAPTQVGPGWGLVTDTDSPSVAYRATS